MNETNFPLPGPICDNGKLLRSARFDKTECSDYRSAQELPLLNEHGDIFNRQLSDDFNEQCDENPQNYKNRPLAGESEYFYDQFIDYPPKDGPNISHVDLNPSQKYQTEVDFNNTVLNANFLNQPPPPPESAFTFFGYPLNFGRMFGGRGRSADRRNEKSVSSRSPSARGLIKNDLDKYLKESQARVRFIDSASEEGTSGEISSTFRTAFKPPTTVESGGFRPILPRTEYGFFPSPSTTATPPTVFIEEKKMVQIMTKDPQFTHNSLVIPKKGNVVRVVSTVSTFPVDPTTFVQPITSTMTTTTTTEQPTTATSSTTTERTPSEEEYDEDYEQIEQTTQRQTDEGDEEEILNVSSSIESFETTSETILLIPPEEEQTTLVFTRSPFTTPSTPIVYSTRPVISRSKITKVPSPKSAFDVNHPTAEEYSRKNGYPENEPSNEFLTTGEEERSRNEFDITTKKGMEWYYEDYRRANKRRASYDEASDKVQYPNSSCKQRIGFSFIFVSMFFILSGNF